MTAVPETEERRLMFYWTDLLVAASVAVVIVAGLTYAVGLWRLF